MPEAEEPLVEPLEESEPAPQETAPDPEARVVFVVPCFRRRRLAEVCLRQLRRTVDELADAHSIDGQVVLVSNEAFFVDLAEELEFDHIAVGNLPLGKKWNDGIEHACRELAADFVVTLGSDDVVDAELIARLPDTDKIRASRSCSIVNEDCSELTELQVDYDGGVGVRTYPRALLEQVGFRPANERLNAGVEDFKSAVYEYVDLHPAQIVGFKSAEQLTPYETVVDAHGTGVRVGDPLGVLADTYPAELLGEIADVYGVAR